MFNRFLKGIDELSNSCRLLSMKKDAAKKTLDFADVVMMQMKLRPELKKEEKPKRKRVLSISHKPYGLEPELPSVKQSPGHSIQFKM